MTGLQTRSLVGSTFGLIFVVANAGALPEPVSAPLRIAAIATFVAEITALRHLETDQPHVQARGTMDAGYFRIVAAEAIAGVTGAALITGPLRTPDAAVAWISLVVGVHFMALAAHWHQPLHRHVGTLIAGAGLLGLLAAGLGAARPVIATVAGITPGIVLLVAAALPMLGAQIPRAAARTTTTNPTKGTTP